MPKANEYAMQSRFSKIHIYISFLFVIPFIIYDIKFDELITIVGVSTFVILGVLNYIGTKKMFFQNKLFYSLLRYCEIIVASVSFVFVGELHLYTIAILCYAMLIVEAITLIYYTDTYYRSLNFFMILCPGIISIVIQAVNRDDFSDELFIRTIIFFATSAVVLFYSILNESTKNKLEQQLFERNRMVTELHNNNLALIEYQEKINRINADIGVKKIMLQEANKRIESSSVKIEIQSKISKYISSSIEINILMDLITDSVFLELNLDLCAVVIKEETLSEGKLLYKIANSCGKEVEENLKNAFLKGDLAHLLENKQILVDNRVVIHKYGFIRDSEIGSLLISPLILEGNKRVGFLVVASKKYDFFKYDIEFYESIVDQIIIAIQNANMYERMHHMAIVDSLSGLYNRAHITSLLANYQEKMKRNKENLTFVLIDIDRFKKINDSYGHLGGDQVIKSLGAVFEEFTIDRGGFVGRYGGEEFVIIFPRKDLIEVKKLMEELRERIKALEVYYLNHCIKINISIGISSYPETCESPYDLVNNADIAMYYSKQTGRDKITLDSPFLREKLILK